MNQELKALITRLETRVRQLIMQQDQLQEEQAACETKATVVVCGVMDTTFPIWSICPFT